MARPVIICGFGRMGQIVGRILRMRGIGFTALEQDSAQVEVVRRFGSKVYYGNPSRPDLLRAAGAEHAKLLVVTLDDMEEVLEVVDMSAAQFPQPPHPGARPESPARASADGSRPRRDRARDLPFEPASRRDGARGARHPARRRPRRRSLSSPNTTSAIWSRRTPIYEDERQLIQSSRQAADELAGLFEADQEAGRLRAAAE